MVAPHPDRPDPDLPPKQPTPLTPVATAQLADDSDKDIASPAEFTMLSDIYAEDDVAWVPYQGTFKVQLRYVEAKLQRKISKMIESFASRRQRRRSAQDPNSLYTNEASAKAYAELVVLNWEGLYEGTKKAPKEIVHSIPMAEKLLTRNIDMLNWVSDQSADPANFITDENVESQEKK